MPNLYRIPSARWGDMFLDEETGKIFSVASDGQMVLIALGDGRLLSRPEGNNDDGQEDSCVPIAIAHLEAVKDSIWEKVEFAGTVTEFLRAHPAGKYFVTAATDGAAPHAFAVISGGAFNLKFSVLPQQVLGVWQTS